MFIFLIKCHNSSEKPSISPNFLRDLIYNEALLEVSKDTNLYYINLTKICKKYQIPEDSLPVIIHEIARYPNTLQKFIEDIRSSQIDLNDTSISYLFEAIQNK